MLRSFGRLLILSVCTSLVLTGAAAHAELSGSHKALFDAVPSDAWAVIAIPSLEKFEAKVAMMSKKLGMNSPPPIQAGLGMIGLASGTDMKGGLAIVVFDTKSLGQEAMVMMVPSADPDAMIKGLPEGNAGADDESEGDDEKPANKKPDGAKDADGDFKTCSIMGQPLFAAKKGKFVLLGRSKSALGSVLKSKSTLGAALEKARAEVYGKSDLIITANAHKFVDAYGELVKQWGGMFAAMAGPQGAQLGDGINEILDMLGQVSSADICVQIDDGGAGLVMLGTPKSGSDLDGQWKAIKPRTTSLLSRLAKEKYLFAAGGVGGGKKSAGDVEKVEKQIMGYIEAQNLKEKIDEKKVKAIVKDLDELGRMLGDNALAISSLPEGPDGIIGGVLTAECTDPAKFMAAMTRIVATGKTLSDDEEFKKFVGAVVHTAGAETIGGQKVDHLTVDLAKLSEDAEAEELAQLNKIIGKDGLLLRFGPAGKNQIVMTLGGGKDRFEQAAKAAAANEGGLGDDTGISKVGKRLPKGKISEFYIAVDSIMDVVSRIMKATGEDPPPFKLANVNAPIAGAMTVEGGSGRLDFFVPMELMTAFKDAYMASMAGDEEEEGDEEAAPAEHKEKPAEGKSEKPGGAKPNAPAKDDSDSEGSKDDE